MILPMSKIVLRVSLVLTILSSGIYCASAAIGPSKIGVFGPTGLELSTQAKGRMVVRAVYRGAPADGIVSSGLVIKAIQGKEIPEDSLDQWDQRAFLGGIITAAEAGDGMIELTVSGDDGEDKKLSFTIPTMVAYSETWPVDHYNFPEK